MDNQTIKTTVLIPHYNNLEGLYKSLESISSHPKVRVLIVDDGSRAEQRPGEAELQKRFGQKMELVLLLNEQNRGIEHVLNQGLQYILRHFPDCPYIARLDCGDICHPERFAIQEQYMDEHPEVALLGCWVNFYDMEGNYLFTYKAPLDERSIRKKMYLKSLFIHPAVIMRTSAVKEIGFYPYDYPAAEDYAYFFKFVKQFPTAIIPQSLISYIWNPSGISATKRKKQLKSRVKVIWANRNFGNLYFWLGLLRVCALLLLPYSWILFLKRRLNIQ